MKHYIAKPGLTACGISTAFGAALTGYVYKTECPFCINELPAVLEWKMDEVEAQMDALEQAKADILAEMEDLLEKSK